MLRCIDQDMPVPLTKLALGHRREASDPAFVRAVLGELVLTFLFVFVGVGSAIVGGKAVAAGGDTSAALISVALGHALVVAVFATAGFHISGAHMNPAVTLSLAVGGHVTLFRSAFFVPAQMLGSSLACILLRALTGGLVTPVHALTAGVGPIQGVVAEVVFTFTLLFTIYAAILDPKSLAPGFGPLLTGLLVGANTIAGAALTGASMNPARSFGPALATGNWANHWVYWVGPLAGGPLAVAVYEFIFTIPTTHQQLPVME